VTLGIVVAAGPSVLTAKTLHSLASLEPPPDQVVVVLPNERDARVEQWLVATCQLRGWSCVPSGARTLAAAFNSGLAQTTSDWVLLVDAGDTVPTGLLGSLNTAIGSAGGTQGLVAGTVRVVGLDIDDRASIDAACPAGVDPGHPALRGVVWRRDTVAAAGGLDEELPVAARYELLLRLLGLGAGVGAIDDVVMHVTVDEGSALRAELGRPEFAGTVAVVADRHRPVLAAAHLDVLELRARRVTALRREHLAALRRHRDAELKLQALGEFTTASPTIEWRASPLSRDWGYERGGPVDRHYIEQFLAAHASDIRGDVLEVQEADYATRFGGAAVTRSDVVDVASSNANATIVTDLRCAANVSAGSFDCVILTQTIHVIDRMDAVIRECHRMLRPGGVLLVTAPTVSRVCLEYGRDGDLWRVTPDGLRCLLTAVFGDEIAVSTYGNAGAGAAFLLGAGRPEVPLDVLGVADAFYPMLVGARAIKSDGRGKGPAMMSRRAKEGVVLLYHRVGGTDPDPHRLNVPTDAFATQMEWLSRTCAVVSIGEMVEGARRGSLPSRAVAVTFDDGYLDTLVVAAPILERFKLPATCFVTTAGLDGPHEFWWDKLAAALLGDGDVPPSIDTRLTEGPVSMPTTTRGLRLFAHNRIYHALVRATSSERDRAMAEILRWSPTARLSPLCRRMTADEIRTLARGAFDIGAHTATHPLLPLLSSDGQAAEISASRGELERVVGRPVTSVAYPFGGFDETTLSATREAGIGLGFTCGQRSLDGSARLLALPRIDPQTARLDRFVAVLENGLRVH
jgi:peptidoglycan/xylan/chitin deacetylase (PgdA/CDA1 family)